MFWASLTIMACSCVLGWLVWHWAGRPRPVKAYISEADARPEIHWTDRFAESASLITPFRVIFIGTALAIYILLWPIVSLHSPNPALDWPKALFATLLATIRTFAADSDLRMALASLTSTSDALTHVEAFYTVFLMALAPLLAVGFLLSFLQAFSARMRYLVSYWHDVNIFSELNDRSIALARSIKQHDRRAVIVFTGVILTNNLPSVELIGQARRLRAICFKADVTSLPFHHHSKSKLLRFFIIGSNDTDSTWQAWSVLRNPAYGERGNTDLYVFSDTLESELALGRHPGQIKVRRINPARAVIYDWLWRDEAPGDRCHRSCGIDLFRHAIPQGADKLISAVVLGLGDHGSQMVRALAWYGQMDDGQGCYRLRVHAFDSDQQVTDQFAGMYNELLAVSLINPSDSSQEPRQDAAHHIVLHGGVDVLGLRLNAELTKLGQVSFVFVCVGDDSKNLLVASNLRRFFARQGQHPQILAVSRNSARVRQALQEQAKMSPAIQAPCIDLLGDTEEIYSHHTITRSSMEHNGEVAHAHWTNVLTLDLSQWKTAMSEFWEDEYSYSSSLSVPIHWKARRALGIPSANQSPEHRSDAEREFHRRLEHARWNAFMRAEGFAYGPVKDRHVAKTHSDLVPFDQLPEKQRSLLAKGRKFALYGSHRVSAL